MLAEYGTLSLKDVLAPAIQMADGYPMEAQLSRTIDHNKDWLEKWKYSREVMLPNAGDAPEPGQIFVQKDLAATWRKLVDAEQQALEAGKTRKEAIYAAYDRFYKGDIAQELVRGVQEEGGLFTMKDLADWKVRIEEPLHTSYKGIEVYKLPIWQQGPVMLQTLNLLENVDDLKGTGLQLRALHPHALPGDEPRLRRPRLLLRRPLLPARGAGEGAAVEGVREVPLRDHRLGSQRPEREARRPVCLPGRHEPVPEAARRMGPAELRADRTPRT